MMKLQYGGDIHPYTCGNSCGVVMNIELLVCDILSRLPVKSLMRFKCVCKQWQSLIHKDRSFIDLHFKRSKTSSNFAIGGGDSGISLFIEWPVRKVFSSAKLLPSEGGVAAVQREVPIPGASDAHVFGAVNGLLSLVELSTYDVCVFNPSTGQSTPWIQSMFTQQYDQIGYVDSNWYYFGYDPATMEHKVVLFWVKRICDCRGDFLRYENICEVMTVDGRQHNNNLSWRRIDDELSLLPKFSPSEFTSSVNANGSIYWLRTGPKYSDIETLIFEFNVGSEKFRVLSIPNYMIIKEARKLIQIDGRLAVLARTTMRMKILKGFPDNQKMRMYVLHDKKLKDIVSSTVIATSSATGSTVGNSCDGDFYWTQHTFMMPYFDWKGLQFDSIEAVPGTDLLIIRSEGEFRSTFYFYDWRTKSFCKDEQFSIEDMKSSSSLQPYSFQCIVYKESILPVI